MGKVTDMCVVLVLVSVLSKFSECDAYVVKNQTKLNDTFALDQKPSTAVFPASGSVYPEGAYYVTVALGDPSHPYSLDIDSGSVLTWVHCKDPSSKSPQASHPPFLSNPNTIVPCVDPICKALDGKYECKHPTDRCDYVIEYSDKFVSNGFLVKDAFKILLTNLIVAAPRLTFGCGYHQEHPTSPDSKSDGVFGLGRSEASIASQLHATGVTRNVVGHCLGSKRGFVFIGDGLVPSTGITWTPMSQTGPSDPYYSPGPAELVYGTKSTGVNGLRLVFDSGSTYTYFNRRAYSALISTIEGGLQGKPLHSVDDGALTECWKGDKPFKAPQDIKGYFSSVTMKFSNAQLEIPPEGYMIITNKGNACLGILDGTATHGEVNVLGDTSFQDIKVVYDNENRRIGWIKSDCSKPQKV